jgi:hypothetical protein
VNDELCLELGYTGSVQCFRGRPPISLKANLHDRAGEEVLSEGGVVELKTIRVHFINNKKIRGGGGPTFLIS